MGNRARCVLLLPFLVFGSGVWLYFKSQNEVRVLMARAQQQWRLARYDEAIQLYDSVFALYPESRYADDALWEMGTIYYVNHYDIDRALSSFQRLMNTYPGTPLARDSCLKLAEISEVALQDLPSAVDYWRQVLAGNASRGLRREISFKVATAFLKMDRFDEALRQFAAVRRESDGDHLSNQAGIRIGTILQIKKEYAESLDYFQEVLERADCADCRVQARLGMIESYEFMDELPKAIATAETIPSSEYPEALKRDLLRRLVDKRKIYEPRLWTER